MGFFDRLKNKHDTELEQIEREAYEEELKTKTNTNRAQQIEEAKERGRLKASGVHPTITKITQGAKKAGAFLEKANTRRGSFAVTFEENRKRADSNFSDRLRKNMNKRLI